MDTGKNKLSAEMMKKLYEAYKLDTKKKIDEFNEAARKIISDKEYPEAEEVLKLVEDTLIADNHEVKIHDPSICKYRGKQVLHSFFDEPPRPTITIDSIPDTVREEAEREALLYGDSYIFTGATQNFKQQQNYDKLKVLLDILGEDAPIWARKLIEDKVFITVPKGRKSWLWLKLWALQKSYEINLVRDLEIPPSTKVDLKSVIHMRWPKQDLSNLKACNFRYGKMLQDQALINYANGDCSHIDMMILDSLATFGPDINSGYGLSTPNLNDIDKKKLERVIKRRKSK